MKKHLFLYFLLLSGLTWGQTQNVEFIKKNFKDDTKGFRKAMDSMSMGDAYYKQGPDFYHFAIGYYICAENFNPSNDMLNYKIGQCFLNSAFKGAALQYLQKAYQINPNIAPDIHYLLGRGYHLDAQWDKAKQEYNAYMGTIDMKKDKDAPTKLADAKKKIDECNNGIDLMKNPLRVFIDNIGPAVNTQYPEYGPIITADESEIIFTSRRPNTTGGMLDGSTGQYFEDLYISYFKNGAWTTAINMGPPINTKDHDATAGLSPDGQTLFIYLDKDGGDLYQTTLKGDKWSKPDRMNSKVNTPSHESSITVGPDGKTFYFVSNRPGGFGDRDIYKITQNDKGKWTDPQNLGPTINTQWGEEGVDIQADGKTLYFSSQGHKTMGGYDIFKSTYENGQWSEPENIGYPVNTPDDDVFFVMNASGKHGYYASVQKGGYGEKDIYMATFLGPEKPVALSDEDNLLAGSTASVADMMAQSVVVHTTKTTLLKGIIYDSISKAPLEASIDLIDNVKNQVIASFTSNSTTGKYLVSLPSGVNYGISVKAPNYLFYSANFNLPDTAAYKVVEKNIPLQNISIGSRIVLRNIFFDFDKATLRPESTNELDRLVALLTQYANLKIEISGYTDNKGSAAYNQTLSQSRSKSVVDYLIAHGIAAARLTFRGYGMDSPIATNDTDDGRQLNRRTEFKITGN